MRLKKQFLYTDMDGTLLNSQHAVSPQNLDAIRSFTGSGGYFSIATGRSEEIAEPYIRCLPVNLPAILYNGAAVYDFAAHTFLHKVLLPAHLVQTIFDTALSLCPTLCVEGFSEGPLQLLNPDGRPDPYILKENQPYKKSVLKAAGSYVKLLLYGFPEELLLIYKALEPLTTDGCTLVFSAPFYLEILPHGVSKGKAMAWIANRFHYPLDQFCAIGDYDNDAEMLLLASLGAAPSNASLLAKSAADVIVSSHEEHAIEDLIRNHLLTGTCISPI